MRITRYSLILLAALAAAACGNDNKEQKVETEGMHTVNFLASEVSTKTYFADRTAAGYYPLRWGPEDVVSISMNGAEPLSVHAVRSEDYKTARFSAGFPASSSYRFNAVSPSSAVKGYNATKGALLLGIPWVQTPGASSADPGAIILGASTPQTDILPDPVNFSFSHLTAYLRLTLTGLSDECGALKSIDLCSSKAFAGDWYYSLSDGSFEERDASHSVRIAASSAEDLWIACAPVDMSGAVIIVTANCESGSLSTMVELPSGRQYSPGMVSILTVDMSGAEKTALPQADEAFLASAVPGYSLASASAFSYQAGKHQLSRTYEAGKVTFSIIPDASSIISFGGIPEDAMVGDSFDLDLSSASEYGREASVYRVTVVKEDGSLVWLVTSDGDKFIVKK